MTWQPIATAPKCVDILVVAQTRANDLMGWGPQAMVGRFGQSGRFSSRPGWWSYQPTHWMPLPELPEPSR